MKKLIFKKREKKEKTGTKSNRKQFLPFLVSFFPAFFVYRLSKNIFLTALLPLSVLSMTLLFQEQRKTGFTKEKQEILSFYHDFLLFSSLKRDYVGGFKKALELLPLSALKDRINDYLEKEEHGPLPLSITNSREEFRLIGVVSSLVNNNEEYCVENRVALEKRISAFEKEGDTKNHMSPSLPMILLLLVYLCSLLLSILSYE